MAEPGDDSTEVDLDEREKAEVHEKKQLRPQVLYEAIRLEGEHELKRPPSALAWSGLAAGLSMGFSLVAMGLARAALPEAPWTKLLVNLGYCIGFVIVIVARQQLFTENTITPVIPLLQNKDKKTLTRLFRLWGIVFVTNIVGTLVFSFVLQRSHVFPDDAKHAFAALGQHTMDGGFASHFTRAIFAGWLIALMVWMLAGAEARAFIVVAITYVIGIGDLSHVIAGSSEAFYAVWNGDATPLEYLTRFLLPVGLGNMIGGMALVTALGHAQVAADANS